MAKHGRALFPRPNSAPKNALSGPSEGKKVVIVSHKPNLQDAVGKEFGDLAEGETVVFKPLGGGKFKTVARVTSETWRGWAE